ncbi:hypothetical protein SDC9_186942 [bioreactor metagenome]|uniref:Uncharacterized protein n=1 Tax=bioreactor metagenome TaxID=1076179 RepID=A0A645HTD3_9ZZZZ
MALPACDGVSDQPAQQNPQNIGGETDAHDSGRVFMKLQHFPQDTPPKQVVHAAGAQHQGIDHQIIRP